MFICNWGKRYNEERQETQVLPGSIAISLLLFLSNIVTVRLSVCRLEVISEGVCLSRNSPDTSKPTKVIYYLYIQVIKVIVMSFK